MSQHERHFTDPVPCSTTLPEACRVPVVLIDDDETVDELCPICEGRMRLDHGVTRCPAHGEIRRRREIEGVDW